MNAATFGGFTPIMFAAQTGSEAAVRILHAAGADVNLRSPGRHPSVIVETPLFLASFHGNGAAAAACVDVGAEIDAISDDIGRGIIRYTAVHAATCFGYTSIVRMLLEHGADPLIRTGTDGSTVLDMALSRYPKWSSVELIRLLRAASAWHRRRHATACYYGLPE